MAYKKTTNQCKHLKHDNVKCSVGRWRNNDSKLEACFGDSTYFVFWVLWTLAAVIVCYKALFSFQVRLYNLFTHGCKKCKII